MVRDWSWMAEELDYPDSPYDRPRRADFQSDLAFVEAFHEYKRRVTRDANESFDRALVRVMRVAV